MNAYDKVLEARAADRPQGGFYIDRIIDGFIELHGDRSFGDDGAIVGGVGYLDKRPVTVITMFRGNTLEERMKRNFGCPSPEGYRKALRLMKQAEKFKRPVICFVGSPGAYCGITAEERGQGQAIAQNLWEMSALKTPIVTVVTGEGGSGGALALSVSDRMIMFENAVYSVVSPEGCATILWKDAGRAKDAAEILGLTSADLYRLGVADEILTEASRTPEQIAKDLKKRIAAAFKTFDQTHISRILATRYERYRKIGAFWG